MQEVFGFVKENLSGAQRRKSAVAEKGVRGFDAQESWEAGPLIFDYAFPFSHSFGFRVWSTGAARTLRITCTTNFVLKAPRWPQPG